MQRTTLSFGGPLTNGVKVLLIVNAAIFLFQLILDFVWPGLLITYFGLHYQGIFTHYRIWELLTYMFLHDGWLHIFSNLLALWMFSGELEIRWGTRRFVQYYILTGFGAGICILILNIILKMLYNANPVTIGASGAIFAILLAYGVTWPDRTVLWSFIIPIKMKYLVLFYGLFALYGTIISAKGAGGNISHIGHLGGLLTGLILIKVFKWDSSSIADNRFGHRESALSSLFKRVRIQRKKQEIEARIKAKKIIDELLEKIARNGMKSLTPSEKKSLDWARKHYHPDSDTMH